MQTKPLTDAQLQNFNDNLANVWGIYQKLNTSIEKIINDYGDVWERLSRSQLHPNQAEESHKELLLKAQNTNQKYLTDALEHLFRVKSEYLEAILPSVNTKHDILEITLLEKELSVMSDADLDKFYNENWQDNALSRLSLVEMKKRSIAKHGSAAYVTALTRDNHKDDFTKEVDSLIKFATVMLRDSGNTFYYISDPVTRKTHPATWTSIFKFMRIRNHGGKPTGFKLKDMLNPQFGYISDQELSIYARRNNLQTTSKKLI